MNERVIVYDPFYCSGCMSCMTACSTYNNGATSLTKARLQIMRHEGHAITGIDEEDDLVFDYINCQHCEDPICQHFCPTLAIHKDRDTGAVVVDKEKCVGCGMCLAVCPFGAISYDSTLRRITKCELCGGEPQCVRFCPTGALQFVPKDLAHLPKRDRLGRKKAKLRGRISEEKPV